MSAKFKKASPRVSAADYFVLQHRLFKRALNAYARKKNNDSLHQLRVAIKKMNALLILLHKLNPDFDYEAAYVPYKNIFKRAGFIREEILQSERLKQGSENKQGKRVRVAILSKLNTELFRVSKAELVNAGKALPFIQSALGKLKQKEIIKYCEKLFAKVEAKWKNTTRNAEIHKFRKHLKQLLYCSHLLSQKQRDELISSKKHKRIDKLQEAIGQWHDNILLLNKISGEHVKVGSQFLQSIQDETKSMLKEIHQKGDKL